MTIYFLILFGIYFLLLIVVLAGWMVATQKPLTIVTTQNFITVIVPYRNERDHLIALLDSLHRQDYPAHLMEVVLINDHSTDDSEQIVTDKIRSWKNFSTITSAKHGKKNAITEGVQRANGSIIATTDADCVHPQHWLSSINLSFQDSKAMLSIGLVVMAGKSFWFRLQRMEFYSVMSVTLSMLGWRNPILCNGANLAFRKKAFTEVGGYHNNLHLASGDDEFLLRDVVKKYGRNSVDWHDASVTTAPQSTLSDFLRQRLRWASKWRHNSSGLSKAMALFVWMVQLSWWPLILFSFLAGNSTLQYLVGAKVFLEFFLLFNVALYFKTRFDNVAFMVLQILYAGYVVWVGLFSWSRSVSWKDRTVT